MSRIRGLELLFNLVKNQFQSKVDCLIVAVHSILINQNLQCMGISDTFADTDSRSELLPKHWNANQEVYTLRYINKGGSNRYLVKAVKSGSMLHINVVLNEEKPANMSVNVDSHVANDYSEYETAYIALDVFSDTFRRDIYDRLHGMPSSSDKKSGRGSRSPPRMGPVSPTMPHSTGSPDLHPFPTRPSFPRIGDRDLDPLGRGHGGMLFDPNDGFFGHRPRVPGDLPRGAVPPGARFDPFNPIRGPNRSGPNPDHFRPPNYDDFNDFI